MKYPYSHSSVRLTGRWDTSGSKCATATATGSYIEVAFTGKTATLAFDVKGNNYPHLHLWIEVDGGAAIEAPIDAYLRVTAKTDGEHICKIIYKGGTEAYSRWYAPLEGKISFIGYTAEGCGTLPEDNRRTIEFVGDSITEGVLIDVDYCGDGKEEFPVGQHNRVYQDDVCATYAWLIAEALDLRPIFMGYGAVGVTHGGQGEVPAAQIAYPYNFDGSPITHAGKPRYILINHGANDRKNGDRYVECYLRLLDVIRAHNPSATLIVLSPFCGAFRAELAEMVSAYRARTGCDIHFIDGGVWVPAEPLHPLRDGHAIIAEQLVKALRPIVRA